MNAKDDIKYLFFNYPTKHWHFAELVTESKLSRSRTNAWLKKLVKEQLIQRFKPKSKMPYYIATQSPKFKAEKKLFAMNQFVKTGFLEHLASLHATTIIIFGSFSRWDWSNESDIDVFIYGNADNFEKGHFEKILHREIQVFHYSNIKSLKRLDSNVIPNIMAGIHIKGTIEPFMVSINA